MPSDLHAHLDARPAWRVELHAHSVWSKDCVVALDTIRRICQRRGIDRIALTDHNTISGALEMAARAPDLFIVGEEIMTTHGELLGYFMRESVPPGLSPDETIERLRAQGAVISVSHPYDRLRKGAWEEADLLRIIDRVDAIETFNSRCIYREDNARAQRLARERGLPGTVGSDAHSRVEYGRAVQVMPPFHDAPSFLHALRHAVPDARYSSVLVHGNSFTAKWSRRLGLRRRLWEGG
jgi:hypothetical protein